MIVDMDAAMAKAFTIQSGLRASSHTNAFKKIYFIVCIVQKFYGSSATDPSLY